MNQFFLSASSVVLKYALVSVCNYFVKFHHFAIIGFGSGRYNIQQTCVMGNEYGNLNETHRHVTVLFSIIK